LPLLSQSSNPEDPIPLLTSAFLNNLVSRSLTSSSKSLPRDEDALPKLYSYLINLAKSQDSGLQDIGVQGYSTLLRTRKSRELFWKQRENTINPLMDTLRSAAGAVKDTDSTLWSGATSIRGADAVIGGGVGLQLLYHVLLVIWQLSFEGKLVAEELEA
jgi:V-type H+-transporting ATPase subunit H